MAYNTGFPMGYAPYYPQNYPQQMQQMPQGPIQQNQIQQPQIQQPQQNMQQIQNGGFMLVPSEDIVKTYPVAPGNCVTFKIEGKPIVMEKSMGFSQLEAPRVDRYRLVREEEVEAPVEEPKKEADYSTYFNEFKEQVNQDLDKMWNEINAIRGQISKPQITKKKDAGGT